MSPRILVLLAVLGCALGGCADDPEPKITADPTPSVSAATAPPTSAVPKPQTGEEFIREWTQTGNEMQNSGDVTAYAAITRGCTPCEKTATTVSKYYAAGGYIRFSGREVQSVERLESDDSTPVFRVVSSSGPTDYKESAAAPEKHLDGGQVIYKVYLTYLDGVWAVANYTELAS